MTYSITTCLYILIYSFTITFTLLIHVSIFNGLQCYSITLLTRVFFLNTFILNFFRLLYLNNHSILHTHFLYSLFKIEPFNSFFSLFISRWSKSFLTTSINYYILFPISIILIWLFYKKDTFLLYL